MKKRWVPGMTAVLTIFAFSGPGFAAEPFKDFTFRSVKPPAAGVKKRINIQIQPPSVTPEPTITPVKAQAAGKTDWFWAEISPDITASAPGRFEKALKQLALVSIEKAVPTPRVSELRQIVTAHGTDILLSTIGKKVSPALVLAMIGTESGGKPDALSSAGAAGLMQLMPATASRFGVTDPNDPAQNIKGGVAYMEWLLDRFDGDPILALAAYNAGENSITEHQGVPPYQETRAYVPKVIAAFQVARALCMTPPELFSDGCVFDLKGGQ